MQCARSGEDVGDDPSDLSAEYPVVEIFHYKLCKVKFFVIHGLFDVDQFSVLLQVDLEQLVKILFQQIKKVAFFFVRNAVCVDV